MESKKSLESKEKLTLSGTGSLLRDGPNGIEVFYLRRTASAKYYPELSVQPGGHNDPEETILQTVTRELAEEAGVDITSQDLVYWDTDVTDPEQGKKFKIVQYLVDGNILEAKRNSPDEHDCGEWISARDALTMDKHKLTEFNIPPLGKEFAEEITRFDTVKEVLRFAHFRNDSKKRGVRVAEPKTVAGQETAYAGSFDIFTRGHLSVIKNILKFNPKKLTIAIGVNPFKQSGVLAPIERKKIIEEELRANGIDPEIIEITFVEGNQFLVDDLWLKGIEKLVIGIRDETDVAEEAKWAGVKKAENPEVENLFLQTEPEETFVSSSNAKLVDKLGGFSAVKYVSSRVLHALQARNRGAYLLGMTGGSGTGKSTTSNAIKKHFEQSGIPSHHIKLDEVAHEITSTNPTPMFEETRKKLVETFGNEIANEDGSIDRDKLGEIVFGDEQYSKERKIKLDEIMRQPMLVNLKKHLRGKAGVVMLDAALLAEFGLSHIVNHNMVLIDADEALANTASGQRDSINIDLAKKRSAHQAPTDKKRELIQGKIKEEGYGSLIELKNDHVTPPMELAKQITPQVLKTLDIFGELRIKSVFEKLGIKDPEESYQMIRSHYSENHRTHRNLDNIVSGLDILWKIQEESDVTDKEFNILVVAWVFHDIIYNVGAKNNKKLSSDMLWDWCEANDLPKEFTYEVCNSVELEDFFNIS